MLVLLEGDDTPSHLTEADEIPHRNTFRDQIVEQPMNASNQMGFVECII